MLAKTQPMLFVVVGLVMAISDRAVAADVPIEAPSSAEATLFIVNDNSVSYSYAFTATNPGAGQNRRAPAALRRGLQWS